MLKINKFKEILFLTETSLGMLLGILLGKILSEFILNTYYVKVIQLDVVKFFKEVLLQNVFFNYFDFRLLIDKISGIEWLNFGSKIFIYAILFIAIFYNFVFDK